MRKLGGIGGRKREWNRGGEGEVRGTEEGRKGRGDKGGRCK